MKILFILGAYKPRASANGLCSSNIIEALKKQGHSVTVLANRNIGYHRPAVEDGVSVYRVKQRLYLRLIEYSEVYAKKKPVKCRVASCLAKAINKLNLFFAAPFWPVISPSTNHRFARMAKKLQKRNHFDVVISVYTPIEALLAGYEVKKKYHVVKFMPYFLDSLSGGYGPKFFSERRIVGRGLKIENKIFSIADTVILMKSSEEHQRKYNYLYDHKMQFLDIPMLLRQDNVKNVRFADPDSKQCRLLFVGSISRGVRDPKTFIDALMCIDDKNIICEFVGKIDCVDAFSRLKEKMGERLIFTPFMEHDKLKDKISSANIMVNIGNLVPTMVPSKIFEYMSYSKPIISTYDIDNEPSLKYLRKYPAALLISAQVSPTDNASSIIEFIGNVKKMQIDYDLTEEQFRLNTPQAFVEVVNKLPREQIG